MTLWQYPMPLKIQLVMADVMTSPKIPICTKMIGSIKDNTFVIWVILFFSNRKKVLRDYRKLHLVITKMVSSKLPFILSWVKELLKSLKENDSVLIQDWKHDY